MKYDILHDFAISILFEKKPSHHFKGLHKLKLLTNFDVQSDFISRRNKSSVER